MSDSWDKFNFSLRKKVLDWPSNIGLKINMHAETEILKTQDACYVGQSETQAKAGLAVAASHVSFIVMVENA